MGSPEHEPVESPHNKRRRFLLHKSPQSFTSSDFQSNDVASFDSGEFPEVNEPTQKRRKLSKKQKGVAFGVAAVTVVGFGAPQVIPNQVDWLVTVVSSRLFHEDNSKQITVDIDPFLEQNKKAITAHENMLNMFRVSDRTIFGKSGNEKELMLFGSSDRLAYATCWPYGRALDATYAMTLNPSIGDKYQGDYQKMLATLDQYWDTAPSDFLPGYDPGPNVQRYKTERLTDDNLWIGLSLMREYKNSHDPKTLERAKAVFDLVTSQWDEKEGGIFWKVQFDGEDNHDKGIVSNGPAIMLGAELYQITHDSRYLAWSEKIYNWVNDNLKDEVSGLYYDHVYPEDTIWKVDKGIGSYAQGVMIGAMTMLNEIDSEKYPIQNALDLADKSMTYFRNHGYDRPSFTSIFFQNLLYLAASSRDKTFTDKIQSALAFNNEEIINSSKKYDDLSDYAGVVALLAMERVPVDKYHLLY